MNSRTDREKFESMLEAYVPSDEKEIAFKTRMQSLLSYGNCFERSLLHAHFTGSAWVIDPENKKVLLTHHAKLDRWLQLGGHADGEADISKVAMKELREESGSDQFEKVQEEIFDIDIHEIPERGDVPAHDHYDVRFLFTGDADKPLTKNHESKALQWVLFEEVPRLVDQNDSILRMLKKTNQLTLSLDMNRS